MKKTLMLTGLMAFALLSYAASEAGDLKVTAKVNMYSGRASPSWDMSPEEIIGLNAKLSVLSPAEKTDVPEWGYVLIENEKTDPEFPYTKLYAFKKTVVVQSDTATSYYKDTANITEWMMELGNKHDASYVPPKFQTLPPNTPYIAVIPASFEGMVKKGEKLQKTLSIFSEGSGPLRGTIMTPSFVSADKAEFDLAAVEGITDVILSIDTGKAGELKGDIIVNSNDPENYEIVIPVKFTVTGEDIPATSSTTLTQAATTSYPASTSPQEQKNGGGYMQYLPYLAILMALMVVAAYVYKKAEDKKVKRQREEFRRWKEEKERLKESDAR